MVRANNHRVTRAKHLMRCAAFLAIVLASGTVFAQADAGGTGMDLLRGVRNATAPGQLPTSLGLVVLVTVIALAPSILVMTTSFTRIIVVLGFLRQAMATQQSPPNQVLIGLALFLTYFIMYPTYNEVYTKSIGPYMRGEITSQDEAMTAGIKPLRTFMFRQVGAKDLALFLEIAKRGRPNTPDDVPTHVLIPAFILSELRIAFQIGFIIYIPFLIIDMVVASTLMAMGMMMLPPIFVSLPFKIILFVLADGWYLLIGSLVRSFH